MKKPLDSIREHQSEVTLALMLAAGAIGIGWQMYEPARPGDEMWRLAKNLVDHGVFASPFGPLETGPTAANPPLYPLILAGLIKIFRVPWITYFASAIINIVADAFVAVLLPRLSKLIYGDAVPGVIAALLWLVAMEPIPGWDTNFTVLGLICFSLCTSEWDKPNKRWSSSATLQGVVAGLLFLLNPSTLLIVLPWIAYLLWRSKENLAGALRYCGTLVALLALFMVGWGVRNSIELGAFVFRTNLGMTLYASNNDCAQSSMIRDMMNGCFGEHHPNGSPSEANYVLRAGEVQYDRRRTADTKAWIQSHPARFMQLTARRFAEFWFPPAEIIPPGYVFSNTAGFRNYRERWMQQQHSVDYTIWISTVLSLFGMALMAKRRQPITAYLFLVLGIYPLMYYAVVSDVRYRFPVLWLTLLPAGYFVCELTETLLMRTQRNALQETNRMPATRP